MVVPDLGAGFVTTMRIATMLVFIASFLGVAVWLLTPAGRRRSNDQARQIMQDDSRPAVRPARMEETP